MPIDLQIQDESGREIARYEGPHLGLSFVELAPDDSVCFRFIDPWGDTTFNQAQIPVLLGELTSVAARTSDPARRGEIEAVVTFLERARGSMHTHAKFIGD